MHLLLLQNFFTDQTTLNKPYSTDQTTLNKPYSTDQTTLNKRSNHILLNVIHSVTL